MEDNEEWKTITDYENYEISSLGNVRNSNTGRVLKQMCKGGYLFTGLSKNSNGKTTSVHRLVALAFIDNPENKPFVNHIDGNKTNNNTNNLEWLTCSENNLHNYKIGLNNGNKRKVIQFDLEMNCKRVKRCVFQRWFSKQLERQQICYFFYLKDLMILLCHQRL